MFLIDVQNAIECLTSNVSQGHKTCLWGLHDLTSSQTWPLSLQLIFWCFSFDTENLLLVPTGAGSTAWRCCSLVNGIIETPVG